MCQLKALNWKSFIIIKPTARKKKLRDRFNQSSWTTCIICFSRKRSARGWTLLVSTLDTLWGWLIVSTNKSASLTGTNCYSNEAKSIFIWNKWHLSLEACFCLQNEGLLAWNKYLSSHAHNSNPSRYWFYHTYIFFYFHHNNRYFL